MASKDLKIKTPRGTIVRIKTTTGTVEAKLTWRAERFEREWTNQFMSAQTFLDTQIVKDCEPYIPMRTGMLIKSGILGTVPGEGRVQWIAPYAKAQYYMKRKPGSISGVLRGPQWFERAKMLYLRYWTAGVQLRAGGGNK